MTGDEKNGLPATSELGMRHNNVSNILNKRLVDRTVVLSLMNSGPLG